MKSIYDTLMEFSDLTTQALTFLFFAAFIAGFIDTLAGGGGLISLPALIISGIPPLTALGTNKLQSSMGSGTATFVMLKNKRVTFHDVRHLMLAAFIGSLLGSIAIQFINTELLTFVIPAILLLIAAYFLFAPIPHEDKMKPQVSNALYQKVIVPIIGWYDGMFGPGTGSFFALAEVSLRGKGLINATVTAKTLNFATNFASLLVFILAGKVMWMVGLVMISGQFIGAWGGSHYLFKINPRHLKIIVVLMCLGMLLKYATAMGWLG